jgi:MFS family permease
VRRLPLLIGAIVLVDTMFYAAVTPLLPQLSDRLDLGKHGAGILAGAYAVGTLLGALPAGWLAARAGVKRTVLAGLGLMTVSGVAFAFGRSIAVLDAARLVQGVGGACSWGGGMAWLATSVPRERRGEVLGAALGAAIFGVQFGPLVGALATAVGQEVAFSSTVAFGAVLGAWALTMPAPRGRADAPTSPARSLRNPAIRAGMLLGALPGLAFGVLEVLAPLRLDVLGASGVAIGAVFFAAAGLEALVAAGAGRLSDRRGAGAVARAGLVAGAVGLALLQLPDRAWLLGVVVVVVAALLGVLWVPAMAVLAAGADHVGLDQGFAFGFFNLSWASGMAVGALAGGALAQATADALPYLLVAGAYGLTALVGLSMRGGGEPTAPGATVSP